MGEAKRKKLSAGLIADRNAGKAELLEKRAILSIAPFGIKVDLKYAIPVDTSPNKKR